MSTNYGFQCDRCDYVTQSEDDHVIIGDEYLCLDCAKNHDVKYGRTHEECDDCAFEKIEPQSCKGHRSGPCSCSEFKYKNLILTTRKDKER